MIGVSFIGVNLSRKKLTLLRGRLKSVARYPNRPPSPQLWATVYTQITKTINFLAFAPLAPQVWGEQDEKVTRAPLTPQFWAGLFQVQEKYCQSLLGRGGDGEMGR